MRLWPSRHRVPHSDRDLRVATSRALRGAGWTPAPGWLDIDLAATKTGYVPRFIRFRHDPVTESYLRNLSAFAVAFAHVLHVVTPRDTPAGLADIAWSYGLLTLRHDALVPFLDAHRFGVPKNAPERPTASCAPPQAN